MIQSLDYKLFAPLFGFVLRPAVTFTPNWSKVFTGQSIIFKCVMEPEVESPIYLWYKDGIQSQIGEQSFTIQSTKQDDSGTYQCRTPTGEISKGLRLEVSFGYLILQVPALVYEGDDVFLRCHSWPGYSVRRTIFYKDQTEFKPSVGDTGLLLKNIKIDMAGRYRCVKKAEQSRVATYADESFIHIRELFSIPKIRVTPNPAMEGDRMILTCHTDLTPFRKHTTLLFAFYRDGRDVQKYSPSNKYEIQPVHLENSAKYFCAIKTLPSNIRKESPKLYIQVQGLINFHGGFDLQQINLLQIEKLFSYPLISVGPNQMKEGDRMTLMCNTSLNQHRPNEDLLFAFYMDEWKIQGFSSSNKYNISSIQLQDSGNYSCEVKTSNNIVMKRSHEIKVAIELKPGKYSLTF
ncbi:high affinity immunoglobulin gamma Fc receptor I-like [Dendrobates tinctorius]|uniref:high affinity immunoglobulin gamma Fc receptor I-like n=1 Tax=Dendrobates tinctorius TaxID=92724 RepID=UPI003CC9AAC7